MPKHKIKVEKPIEPEEDLEDSDIPSDIPSEEPIKYPEVASSGLFQVVPFKDGYLLYNPDGQRVSDILSKVKADDLAHANNLAAHLKPTRPQIKK